MPSTIVTTIGSPSANSYISVVDGDAYFDDRLDAAKWTAAQTADKTRALLQAAKQMQFENWLGSRVNSTQAMAWPRVGVAKIDAISFGYSGHSHGYGYGYWYPKEVYLPTEIPQPVKDAQAELALDLLSGVSGGAGAPTIQSFTLDGLNVQMSGNTTIVATSRAGRLISTLVVGNQLQRG